MRYDTIKGKIEDAGYVVDREYNAGGDNVIVYLPDVHKDSFFTFQKNRMLTLDDVIDFDCIALEGIARNYSKLMKTDEHRQKVIELNKVLCEFYKLEDRTPIPSHLRDNVFMQTFESVCDVDASLGMAAMQDSSLLKDTMAYRGLLGPLNFVLRFTYECMTNLEHDISPRTTAPEG